MLQCPHSPLRTFSCVLRIKISDRSTTCLVVDAEEERIDLQIQRLQSWQIQLQKSPLHILSIFAEEYGCRNERWRENLDHSIVDMEKHIGMTGFDIDALDAAADEFEPLTKDLHIANISLIWLDCTTNIELALEKFSEEMVALLIKCEMMVE